MSTPSTIRHNENAPSVAQAAQIALCTMSVFKTFTWAGVTDDPSKLYLTPEQQGLLTQHRDLLPFLSRGGAGGNLRTVLACTKCSRFAFVTTGTHTAKRCQFTLGCEGSPFRARSTQQPLRDENED